MKIEKLSIEAPLETNDSEEPPLIAPEQSSQATLSTKNNSGKELFPISNQSATFKRRYFPEVKPSEWSNWKWQIANSFTSMEQLAKCFGLTIDSRLLEMRLNLPIRITPYYASLINFQNSNDPIGLSMIPTIDELTTHPGEKSDPLAEESDMPVEGLVHRYPDRVLLLSTDFCAAYCRYCTRSHMVAKHRKQTGRATWNNAIEYIQQHPEVRDVLISGGDFLTYSDQQIELLLSQIRSINHVEIIRIGTKVPLVAPQRITNSLIRVLKKYHPLYMSIHFTHPNELTPEVKFACDRIADAGIPMGSQTVLLRRINDDPTTMKTLFKKLLTYRVRPYYLYQCDPIPGSEHFRTPVSTGINIIENLRGHISGYAIPHYVIDAPGGGGKIPLIPEYFLGKTNGEILLRNYEGNTYRYPDGEL